MKHMNIQIKEDDTVIINGVEYVKKEVKKEKPTLLEVVQRWCDDETQPWALSLVEAIQQWLPENISNYNIDDISYVTGWCDYRAEVIKKIK